MSHFLLLCICPHCVRYNSGHQWIRCAGVSCRKTGGTSPKNKANRATRHARVTFCSKCVFSLLHTPSRPVLLPRIILAALCFLSSFVFNYCPLTKIVVNTTITTAANLSFLLSFDAWTHPHCFIPLCPDFKNHFRCSY